MTSFKDYDKQTEEFGIFLVRCTDLELVVMQHELRKYPEDKLYLQEVLRELKRRIER